MRRLSTSVFVVAACAHVPAFSPRLPDNDPVAVQNVLEKLQARQGPVNRAGRAMAYAVTARPDVRIVAFDLAEGKTAWSQPADVRSRIVVGRDSVFAIEGDRTIVARDAASGVPRWTARIEGGDRFIGLDADEGGLYYVTEDTGRRVEGKQVGLLVALDPATGHERYRLGAASQMGAPAAERGLVFVQFAHQYLVALDGATGEELARVRNKDEVISFVRANPGGVFYGSRGVFRLDERSVTGVREEATFVQAKLPGEFVRVAYWWDGYNPASAEYTAYDRNRLLWEVTGEPGQGRFVGDLVVLHSYRFFFGFDPTSGDLRWAYSFPRVDVVSSTLTPTHVLLVSADGDVVGLDRKTGVPLWNASIGAPVAGVTFDAHGFSPPGSSKLTGDLRETLTGVIWDPDRRFEATKLFCVDQLARLKDPRVAEDLLKIVTFEKIEKKVYERAGQALVDRADPESLPLILKALAVRTDYVEGTRARAVDVLARAAGKLKAKQAVDLLLVHFTDHETSLPAMREIAGALLAIGDKAAVAPLSEFLKTYRADDLFAAEPEVMRRVVEALLKLGAAPERMLLRLVAEDPQTVAFVRAYATQALKATEPAKAKSAASAPAGAR